METKVLALFLDGGFVTRARVRAWSLLLIVATAVAVAFLGITAHGLNDYKGRPLGTDFSNVYAAGELARGGAAPAAYDWERHHHQEQAIFGADTPYYGWHYPPFFLLIAAALASLPYVPALILWQGATLAAYLFALRALLRSVPATELARDPLWLLTALAFPAVFVNLTHGQNGFLTAALLAGGLVLLRPKPLLAGVLFGLTAYKPQFAVLVPLALAAGGQWRSLAAAAATVAVLGGLATLAFGIDIWQAFAASTHLSRVVVLEEGNTGFEKIQSAFAAARLLGAGIPVAYAVQAAVSGAAVAAVIWLWRRPASLAVRGAALCLGVLLATPYSLDYDLVVLAPAIALIAVEGRARGFLSGELLILSALWLVPLLARAIAAGTHLALVPVLLLLALAWTIRRACREI